MNIDEKIVRNILEKLSYKLLKADKEGFELEVPYFRTDVEVEDDLVADVMRIFGFSKIPTSLMTGEIPTDDTDKLYVFEEQVRDTLVKAGLHEHITSPLVEGNNKSTGEDKVLLNMLGREVTEVEQVILENSGAEDKKALRLSMWQGLANVASEYKKRGISEIGLFEIGKVYWKELNEEGINAYKEERCLNIYYENTNITKEENLKIYKKILATIGIPGEVVYKVKPGTRFDRLPISLEWLEKKTVSRERIITEFNKTIEMDVNIVINEEQSISQVHEILAQQKNVDQVEVINSYEDINEDNNKATLFRIKLNVSPANFDKTGFIDSLQNLGLRVKK